MNDEPVVPSPLTSAAEVPGDTGEGWLCRSDVEIQCSDTACAVQDADSSTPVHVEVGADGSLSVCAYSGCWQGAGQHVAMSSFLFVVGDALRFSTAPAGDLSSAQDIAVVIDRSGGVATLKAGSFAMPLRCRRAAGAGAR